MPQIPPNPLSQQIDLSQAQLFLNKFNPSGDHLIVTIPNTVRQDKPIRATRGIINQANLGSMIAINEDRDIYFTINEVNNNTGTIRTKESITKLRCIFLDDDNKAVAKPYPLAPSIVVNTSRGKKQVYWLLSSQPEDMDAWDQVQQTLVNDYGGDANSRDAARIQRIPGFFNRKKDYNPSPLITLEVINDNTYTWEQIKQAFPPSEVISITGKPKSDGFDFDDTLKLFISGDNYHQAGIALIGYFYNTGMVTEAALINNLRALLKSHADENDPRVVHRLNIDIPGSVRWVLKQRVKENAEKQLEIINESIHDIALDFSKAEKPVELTEDIITNLPAPLPLLLSNFKEMIYTPVATMYIPVFMAIHEVLLRSKIRTERDRSVNMNYATGSLSGGGKDDNTTEALRRYSKKYIDINGSNSSFLLMATQLMNPMTGSFTSGTNLLKKLEERGQEDGGNNIGGAIVTTEATEYFKMIGNTGNAHMSDEVMKVEIQAFDGMSIEGRKVTTKESNHTAAIDNPNFSFVRMTQFEAFKTAFTLPMLEKGYYPRIFESFDLRDNEEYVPSGRKNNKQFNVDEEGFRFLFYLIQEIEAIKIPIKVVANQEGTPIDLWDMENMPKIRDKLTQEQFPGMKRIPTMAEKWVSTITAYNYFWLKFKNESVDHLVLKRNDHGDVLQLNGIYFEHLVIPMLDYIARVKFYNITQNISNNGASESDRQFSELWQKCLKAKNVQNEPWTNLGVVVCSVFDSRVNKNGPLNRFYPETQRLKQARDRWLDETGLCRSHPIAGKGSSKKKACYVIKGGQFDPKAKWKGGVV